MNKPRTFFLKKICVSLLILIHFGSVQSQFHSKYFQHEIPADSSKFLLCIDGAGFFHNNEYFSTDEEGYTLIGNYFKPVLRIRIKEELSVSGGYHFLRFHGQNGFHSETPYLNLDYQFHENGNLLIGSFMGGDNHHLPEALYARELHFNNQVMNGVLINFRKWGLKTRTWLNWERFIELGDPFQEEFSFSFSGSYQIQTKNARVWEIPFYFMANHKGGQINNSSLDVETIADFSSGLSLKNPVDLPLVNELEFKGLAFLESDIDEDEDGMAFMGQAIGSGDLVSASLGYFYGKNWESIHGNPILFCGDDNSCSVKSMILLKAGIGKSIGKGSNFSMRFEGYYDTGTNKLQYMYGIYLIVSEVLWKR